MTHRRRIRIRRTRVAGVLLVIALIGTVLGDKLFASSSPTATSAIQVIRGELRLPRNEHHGPLGVADGAVPDGTTVFDDEVPGVANLDPELLNAVRRAAADAENAGVEF